MTITCLLFQYNAVGQCSSAGPFSATSLSNDATIGVRPVNSPANGTASDNSYAWSAALILGQQTNYLRAENFGFSLPASATICGIEVQAEKGFTGLLGNITDASVRLVKNGNISGSDLAMGGSWSSSDSYSTYGGSSSLWGETWTPDDINASNFGVVISANLGGVLALPTARIDHVRIRVYYIDHLPVELLSFDAEWESDHVQLNWKTASESDNKGFHIDRSLDGMEWEFMDFVNGSGTTSQEHIYSWRDYQLQPMLSMYYYRLRQEDYDGGIQILPAIAVRNTGFFARDKLVIFPNPVSHEVNIRYRSSASFPVTLEIADLTGKVYMKRQENIRPGDNLFILEANTLPGGGNYYVVSLKSGNEEIQAKFIK